MNILIVDGDFFTTSLRRLGHDVLRLGADPGADAVLDQILSPAGLHRLLADRGFAPDLALWLDVCRPPSVLGLETLACPVLGYSIDQYLNPWHAPMSAAFDHLFVAQKDYLPLFELPDVNRPASWLPLFCDPETDQDLGLPREAAASFVGTLGAPFNPEREPFLEAVRGEAPLLVRRGDYVPIFNRTLAVLNQSAAGELNFRLFQAMACGAAMLTEDVDNGLRELFTPGRDLFVYPRGDAQSAARILRRALADPERLRETAARGRDKVLAEHGVASRVKRLLKTAASLAALGAPKARLARMEAVQMELAKAWVILATDEHLPLNAADRRFFLERGTEGLVG